MHNVQITFKKNTPVTRSLTKRLLELTPEGKTDFTPVLGFKLTLKKVEPLNLVKVGFLISEVCTKNGVDIQIIK